MAETIIIGITSTLYTCHISLTSIAKSAYFACFYWCLSNKLLLFGQVTAKFLMYNIADLDVSVKVVRDSNLGAITCFVLNSCVFEWYSLHLSFLAILSSIMIVLK